VVQAGASEDGKELAAETADVVFTAHETIESAKAFYRDLKRRMPKFGRRPEDLKIMPGLMVTVAETEEEAKRKFQRLQDLIDPEIGRALIERKMGVDLAGHDVDGPMPPVPPSLVLSSRVDQMLESVSRESLTIRGFYQRLAALRGHFAIVGSPKQIVDHMEEAGSRQAYHVISLVGPLG
jgi:alkanesulfonate monooxygenase SsuD/methylene tetrahydromethanopterin reductase-like flavin-dependent oxidoreductase (luciferase family)